MRILLLAVLLLAGPASAQTALNIVDAVANAEAGKSISISVTVENRGEEPQQAIVNLDLNPKVSKSSRGGGDTLADPSRMQRMVSLGAGEKIVVEFATQYMSSSSQKARKGTFRTSNAHPSGEVPVDFKASLQTQP